VLKERISVNEEDANEGSQGAEWEIYRFKFRKICEGRPQNTGLEKVDV
jgi:hypothetical protein